MIKILFYSCAMFASILHCQSAFAGLYKYSKINYPDTTYSATSLEVNRDGKFATSLDGSTSSGNYIWSAQGAEFKLEMPNKNDGGQVLSLNDHGVSVGFTYDAYASGYASRATAWYGTKAVVLPGLGDNREEVAIDVNNQGEIVGYSRSIENRLSHALFWDNDGLHDLGTGGGFSATTSAINDIGTIVGTTRFADGSQGTIWQNGNVTHIGTLGGTRSVLADVNDLGFAVGDSLLSGDNEQWHAILWDGASLHDLGTLGGRWSSANNVGADGTVFGSATTSNEQQHAAIWHGGSAIDLHDLIINPADLGSLTMMTAIGADSTGAIYGITYDRATFCSGTFVLTPISDTGVPEPTTAALFSIGAAWFVICRRKITKK